MSTYIEYVHARPEFDELLYKLSQANHFTLPDLESNRLGKVGIDQLRYHIKEALMGPVLILLAGFVVSFVVRVAYAAYVEKVSILTYVGVLIGNFVQLRFDKLHEAYLLSAGERLPLITALFVITAPALAWKKMRNIPFRMLFDLLTGRVEREEGSVSAVSEEVKASGRAGKKGETIDLHYYVVNESKIKVTSAGVRELAMGLRYKLYYLKTSKVLLSIEPQL